MTDQRDAPLWENSLLEFRKRIAAAVPTPGGGAVAAVAASFAAALLQMVCCISVKRKPDAGMNAIAGEVKLCEEELARCAEEDIRVFDQYMAARKIQSATAHADTQRCLLACTEVPLAAAEAVVKLEAYAAEIAPKTPEFLSSDLATAQYLLDASRKALLANVTINLADLEDGGEKSAVLRRIKALQGDTNSRG
jgi:glutamate formiminotransferase/formiminotetrahydrofolate cyclodeaminase